MGIGSLWPFSVFIGGWGWELNVEVNGSWREIPANDRRNDGEEKMDNCCRLAGRTEKDESPPTTCGDDGKGGMTVNEQLCRIALFLPNFVQGVVYAYALHLSCSATLIWFRLGRDGLRREV